MATKEIKKEEHTIDIEKIKDEITEYAKEKIDNESQNFFKRNEKRIIKIKNNSIIKRDIVILLLFGLILFLCYQLNEYGYFSKFVKNNNNNTSINVELENDSTENVDSDVDIKEDLISEYSYLLDVLKFSSDSSVLSNLLNDSLDNDSMLSISLLNLDSKYITSDEEGYYIEADKLLDRCNDIFGDKCILKTFNYDNTKIKYLKTMNTFIYDEEIEFNKSNIIRTIYNINIDEDTLEIYTVEAMISNNKIYNYIDNTEIKKCTPENLSECKDKLTKLKYSFLKQDDKYILNKVSGE